MGIFKNIFTWWEGMTFGTWVGQMGSTKVGEDEIATYHLGKLGPNGLPRRMALYKGSNEASRVHPEWHAWLHHQIEDVPDMSLPPVRPWQKPAEPNLTGTPQAYRPAGSLEAGGRRAAATGDYEAWTPE